MRATWSRLIPKVRPIMLCSCIEPKIRYRAPSVKIGNKKYLVNKNGGYGVGIVLLLLSIWLDGHLLLVHEIV